MSANVFFFRATLRSNEVALKVSGGQYATNQRYAPFSFLLGSKYVAHIRSGKKLFSRPSACASSDVVVKFVLVLYLSA